MVFDMLVWEVNDDDDNDDDKLSECMCIPSWLAQIVKYVSFDFVNLDNPGSICPWLPWIKNYSDVKGT
jgi:hypothetical protein